MPIDADLAMKFVNTHTKRASDYRNWAVSDFLGYRDLVKSEASLDELQKTWALYLRWKELCKYNYQNWYSANGSSFSELPEQSRRFKYVPGPDADTPPQIYPASASQVVGMQELRLDGVGQCEYFAGQAFADLKKLGPTGSVPRVEKISTPGHNWVLVNRSTVGGSEASRVVVDYWLLALGVARDKCICKWDDRAIAFSDQIEVVETHNPQNHS